MKKILIPILMMVMMISVVSATTFCYQESANETNQTGIDGNCNLNYSGNYMTMTPWEDMSNAYDGDWETYASNGIAEVRTLTITFITPPNVNLEESLVQQKVELAGTEYIDNKSLSGCDISSGELTLQSVVQMDAEVGSYTLNCWSGSDWQDINYFWDDYTGAYLYDTGIYWAIEKPKHNFSINITNVNNFTVTINGTNYNSTDGYVMTDIYNISESLYNITITPNIEGFYEKEYTNYNVSSNISTTLTEKNNFTITINNVDDVTATINDDIYSTTTGVIVTNIYEDNTTLFDITLNGGILYDEKIYEDYNVSTNIATSLDLNHVNDGVLNTQNITFGALGLIAVMLLSTIALLFIKGFDDGVSVGVLETMVLVGISSAVVIFVGFIIIASVSGVLV